MKSAVQPQVYCCPSDTRQIIDRKRIHRKSTTQTWTSSWRYLQEEPRRFLVAQGSVHSIFRDGSTVQRLKTARHCIQFHRFRKSEFRRLHHAIRTPWLVRPSGFEPPEQVRFFCAEIVRIHKECRRLHTFELEYDWSQSVRAAAYGDSLFGIQGKLPPKAKVLTSPKIVFQAYVQKPSGIAMSSSTMNS